MQRRHVHSVLSSCLASCLLAFCTSCGGTTGTDPGPAQNAAGSPGGPGSGSFSVTSDQPTPGNMAGASFSLGVSFTTHPACTTTKIGACTVNPCYQSAPSGNGSVAAPDAGEVTLVGTGMASLALGPQQDGNYASQSVVGELPWQSGGSSITFQWATFPGDAAGPGDSITVATPPYISLVAGSAFAVATSTLARAQDLTVSWTSDTPPADGDEVVVDLNSDTVQMYCVFSVGAGQGVVPAAALGPLVAGDGTYNVSSKTYASETINEGDGAWSLGFNVNAFARSSYGLAKGSVTIQ